MRGPVRGTLYFLYLILDVWSRKIVGARVFTQESADHAPELFTDSCQALGVDPAGLVLHADNSGPMKGSVMLATLQRLGVVASFSRPRVSDDNPYSEALFRTLKYRPAYPSGPFASRKAAQTWVAGFVHWYNTEHRLSTLRFVTPDERHTGRDKAILAKRQALCETAYNERPERWTGSRRNGRPIAAVVLNPEKHHIDNKQHKSAA